MLLYFFNATRLALIGISVTIFAYFYATYRRGKVINNLPPGPPSWRIVQNLLESYFNTHINLTKLKERYGNVFRFPLGFAECIVLSSHQAVREAYQKTELLDRPPNEIFSIIGLKGVFFANNLDLWKTQRGFVIRSMRDLGLGKLKLEEKIQEEACQVLSFIEDHPNNKIAIVELLEKSTANNIISITFGKRFNYEDPVLVAMMLGVKQAAEYILRSPVYLCFPWLKYTAPLFQWISDDKGFRGYSEVWEAFLKIVEDHKRTFNPNEIRDFTDSYLEEISKIGKNSNFTEESFFTTLMELIGAGADTTSSCILWCIYMVAAYPNMKGKLLREIEDVVGLTEMPSMSVKTRMPYTEAFIYEIIRWVTIVPLTPLRYATESTTLCGYDVPKNSVIVANLWAIHHDPEVWDDPHNFNPDRFLEDDGETLKRFSSYIPFCFGKRKCPGEAMAYMEVFLYLVLILQRFDLTFNPGVKATFESIRGISIRPKNYPIRMISRSNSSNVTFLQ